MSWTHRDRSIHIERANVHCRCITCARSLDMALTSARGQKQSASNEQQLIYLKVQLRAGKIHYLVKLWWYFISTGACTAKHSRFVMYRKLTDYVISLCFFAGYFHWLG